MHPIWFVLSVSRLSIGMAKVIRIKFSGNLLSELEVHSRFFVEDRDRYADDDKVVLVDSTKVEFMMDSDTRQIRDLPRAINVIISSVKQNETMFFTDEVRRARMARDLIAKPGYASN